MLLTLGVRPPNFTSGPRRFCVLQDRTDLQGSSLVRSFLFKTQNVNDVIFTNVFYSGFLIGPTQNGSSNSECFSAQYCRLGWIRSGSSTWKI